MSDSDRVGFDRIIGHDTAKVMLAHCVWQDAPAQALILAGPRSIGKLTLALEYAKAINCENPTDGQACGECAMCRAIQHGNAPDVRIFSPDKVNTTSIDSMRVLRDISEYRPMRCRWKVNIVEQADTLNEESANCILKLLEEPPEYLINILLYRNEASALPTIRSRCRMIRLFQVPLDVLTARLIEDYDADTQQAEFLAAYSQGCPGLAISLLSDTTFLAERNAIAKLASDAARNGTVSFLRLAQNLRNGVAIEEEDENGTQSDGGKSAPNRGKGRDPLIASLDTLLMWYRDLLVARIYGDDAPLVNSDRRDEIVQQAGIYPEEHALRQIIDQILQTRRNILRNANSQIQTEALLARIAMLGCKTS